jgi:hypothetical protein
VLPDGGEDCLREVVGPGDTVYGFVAGLYPTDYPALHGRDEA